MWKSLTLALLLLVVAPLSAADLNLGNVRSSYGELGGTRPDGPLLPGDVLFVGFDIEGIAADAEGKVTYTMAMEVLDGAGKAIFKQEPAKKTDFVPLGGPKLPARAYITIGLDQPAGTYTLKVTVADLATKQEKTLERKFEVLARDFGIVAVYTSVDERGQIPAPTTGVVGQSSFIQFGIVGFARDPKTKQPNVAIEMVPVDETGAPTMGKPSLFNLDAGVDEKDPGFNVRFLLPLTRTGKFQVKLKATDKVSNKTASFTLPLTVVPSAN